MFVIVSVLKKRSRKRAKTEELLKDFLLQKMLA